MSKTKNINPFDVTGLLYPLKTSRGYRKRTVVSNGVKSLEFNDNYILQRWP